MRNLAHLLLWTLVGGAALTGTLMIAVGMFEELMHVVRSGWNRSIRHP